MPDKCVQCGEEIKDTIYENYYAKYEYLCEKWDCWAVWMNENTYPKDTD